QVVITPNLRELKALASALGVTQSDPALLARDVSRVTGAAVVTTFEGEKATVLVVEKGTASEEPFTLVPTKRPVHGTGCRFSTAIACGFAQKKGLLDSVKIAIKKVAELVENREEMPSSGQDYLS
ncbi:MAG TPA: bifunctional hydroxymethylpyrimidine kinase/phosphomethylpyrimidine kinase, partial [bacterium]|nr:bifunctional hydroxymethylpyrimidine kinase/phosphomethylpyrimidine kinase [bacterium]